MFLLIVGEILGVLLLIFSIRTFLLVKTGDPAGSFRFHSGEHAFDISVPGYYSIAIVGAGHIRQKGQGTAKLTVNGTQDVIVNLDSVAVRSRIDGKLSTDYWNFTTEVPGSAVLTLSNVEGLEAKESMLFPKRMFQEPIKHGALRIHVYRSVRSWQRIATIVAFVVSAWLLVGSTLFMFDPAAYENFLKAF